MEIFGVNFKEHRQISKFIEENNNKVLRNGNAIIKVEKDKLKVRLSSGKEFKFNKYGRPIYQDISIYSGLARNKKLYNVANEINKYRVDNLNELQLMELCNKLDFLVSDLNINKETMVQRKSFNNIELATKDSYMKLTILNKKENSFEIKIIGDRFKNFSRDNNLDLDLKEYKNVIKSISDNSLLLKIKAYESGLGDL